MMTVSIKNIWITALGIGLMAGCNQKTSHTKESEPTASNRYPTYSENVSFLSQFIDLTELTDSAGNTKVAVSAALQGRVMTSSSMGAEGLGHGWINRSLFSSGDTLEHINVYGGEERFWLGPEGGQYSLFFKQGDEFTLANWYTPRLIDLEAFDIKEQTEKSVLLVKEASLTNYSGFKFDIGIERKIEILSQKEIQEHLGLKPNRPIHAVAYQTTNSITNLGPKDWKKETGLLSIWLLGMFNPSPSTTMVIPFHPGPVKDRGIPVNDTYFGKVPQQRLVVQDSVLFFSGDGQHRSKIGLSPRRSKDLLGSYDATNHILTILKYNQPQGIEEYVNSVWAIQEAPYAGDVVNAYNDGPPEPGQKPLGPFYELETSSPAMALQRGQTGTHVQLTCHIEGDEKELDALTRQLLGVTLKEITTTLPITKP